MDEASELYDEYGNFIGEAAESEEEGENGYTGPSYVYDEDSEEEVHDEQALMQVDESTSNAIVQYEDVSYYRTAQQIYGEDVETMVQEEDAQPLSEPIIKPVEQKKFQVQETDLPPVYYSHGFLADLLSFKEGIRNIGIAGHLHHGKTAFMDMLIQQTHDIQGRLDKRIGKRADEQLRYLDTHMLERERGLSIKSAPITLVMQTTKGKSMLLNMIDTPGHVNFLDETAASLRLVDGVAIVVDVVEGVQIGTQKVIESAAREDLPMVLIINKMDRLILELKLPPTDAYFKIKHVVEQVNSIIEGVLGKKGESKRLSPEKGNVAFASADMDWVFTLPSFARQYSEKFSKLDSSQFAMRLWGEIFYNKKSRKFSRKAVEEGSKRSFIHWVLEPLYKLYSSTISESPEDLAETLATLDIVLKPTQLKSDAKVLLKLVCAQFFGEASAFVDLVTQHIPSPAEGATRQLEKYYTGPTDSATATAMANCDADGPLVVQITKLYNNADASDFDAFGRVMSGTAVPGAEVQVLGETYSIDDPEDAIKATISDVKIACSRYAIPVSGLPAGNMVLLSGVSNSIAKTATIIPPSLPNDEDAYIFRPIRHLTESVIKVAVEPVNPSELTKLTFGLRGLSKSYPLIQTRVEESGETNIVGTGELQLDCALHDLRNLHGNLDIKVSDPTTRFCETVQESSAIMCWVQSQNKMNRVYMVAEPLDEGEGDAIEAGEVSLERQSIREVAKYFQDNFEWDVLAARNIWAFGPDAQSPNILVDDTIPSTTDKKLLKSVKESIKQGFQWATREGPLAEEPVRNVKFRITKVEVAENPIQRGAGQCIPASRRAIYSAMLTAQPRLMEPVYSVHMISSAESIPALYTVLTKRRGHVLQDYPIAGTPLYAAKALLPVIDSFGFETDLRVHCSGLASVSLIFEKWDIVPGDPLDKSIQLKPLEMAGPQQAARDFLLKTRRRKGLSPDVSVERVLEPELWKGLKESGFLD